MEIQTALATPIHYVAHNGNDVVHYGTIGLNTSLQSGLPNFEEFDTLLEMAQRVYELDPDSLMIWDERMEHVYQQGMIILKNGLPYLREVKDGEEVWTPVLSSTTED